MRFNIDTCKTVHLGSHNQHYFEMGMATCETVIPSKSWGQLCKTNYELRSVPLSRKIKSTILQGADKIGSDLS